MNSNSNIISYYTKRIAKRRALIAQLTSLTNKIIDNKLGKDYHDELLAVADTINILQSEIDIDEVHMKEEKMK
ncbi:MAG: hypothetical protein WC516_08135 [Patescibacteria group bacterium]|jgi:hypothetical protein